MIYLWRMTILWSGKWCSVSAAEGVLSLDSPRRSSGTSSRSSLAPIHDSLMPGLFVAVLRQNSTS